MCDRSQRYGDNAIDRTFCAIFLHEFLAVQRITYIPNKQKKNIFGKFKYIYSTIEWNYCVSGANILKLRLPVGSEDDGGMVETSPSTSICTPGI